MYRQCGNSDHCIGTFSMTNVFFIQLHSFWFNPLRSIINKSRYLLVRVWIGWELWKASLAMFLEIFVGALELDIKISDLNVNQLDVSDMFIAHVWRLARVMLVPASTRDHIYRVTLVSVNIWSTTTQASRLSNLASEEWWACCVRRSVDTLKMLIMIKICFRWENSASTNSETAGHDVI